jgi:CxxC motif-containing protein (DUF1111 family)
MLSRLFSVTRMRSVAILSLLLWASAPAQAETAPVSPPVGDPTRPGGAATTFEASANAYSLPSANLPPSRRVDFSVGNSFFRNPWVAAPSSTTARDGLGSLFNTNACQNCHIKDGRGHPPDANAVNAVSMLVRLSVPSKAGQEEQLLRDGVIGDPVYGGQLQDMANPGFKPEGRVRVTYSEQPVKLADGTTVNLRKAGATDF